MKLPWHKVRCAAVLSACVWLALFGVWALYDMACSIGLAISGNGVLVVAPGRRLPGWLTLCLVGVVGTVMSTLLLWHSLNTRRDLCRQVRVRLIKTWPFVCWLVVLIVVLGGVGLAGWGLGAVVEMSVWEPFVIGFLINIGLIWALLLGRDTLRRRRMEVVAYLAGFLIGPVPCDTPEAALPRDAAHPCRRPPASQIMPASFRLALEKYLFDFDGFNYRKRGRDSVLTEWHDYARGYEARMKGVAPAPMECDNPYRMVIRILRRLSSTLTAQEDPAVRLKLFLMWLPSYLPFAVLAGFFFVEFFPANIHISCLSDLIHPGKTAGPVCFALRNADGSNWAFSRFWLAEGMTTAYGSFGASAFVATFAFAGAYISVWQSFIRGAVSNDLSPMTFLRALRHSITAIVVAVVAYSTLGPLHIGYSNDLLEQSSAASSAAAGDESSTSVSASPGEDMPAVRRGKGKSDLPILWLLSAFAIGFYPDLGLTMLLRYRQLDGAKKVYDGVSRDFESVPIDIIDGIDYEARTRLGEFGVSDIQHLATYNPIVMFAETPSFGLYQSIDWVAQAQLCNAVGIQAFVRLRQWRIRTIFDLERIVYGDLDVPDYAQAVLDALMQAAPQGAAMQRAISGANGAASNQKTVEAVVRVMLDDLHVMRLRQLWQIIKDRLGDAAEQMYRPPGAQDCRCGDPAANPRDDDPDGDGVAAK